MSRFALKTDPMATDPGRWGHSLSNLAEILVPLLDASGARSVIEVGAYAGDVTRLLLEWAEGSGATISSIDPDPQDALVQLADSNAKLELIRATSIEALKELPAADAAIVDGDHNYYTVAEELRLIGERAGETLPLIICHDVCWPHARRDAYYAPEQIPEEGRQETVEGGYLFPGDPGLHRGGLPYKWLAVKEGGPRNGVLTAIEDFVSGREDAELAIVPAFFGLAAVYSRRAPYADAVAALLEPYAGNPVLERLEGNRVLHLARREVEAADLGWCRDKNARQQAFLRKLLESKTFEVAIWLSKLRQRGGPAFTKDEVRRLLED